jgi:hypothetical protein
VHREQVVAVHDARRDPIGGPSSRDVTAGGDLLHRRELAVEVVLADEHRGQLEHPREVEALVEVALVARPVAEERHGHPAGALGREGGPGGRRDAASHDAEAADQPVLEVDHVHRSRSSAADAGGAAEHLRGKRLRVGALGERVPVSPVGAGHVIMGLEREADADRHGLLARRQVGRAVYLALEEQAVDLLLELADQHHPLEGGHETGRIVERRGPIGLGGELYVAHRGALRLPDRLGRCLPSGHGAGPA